MILRQLTIFSIFLIFSYYAISQEVIMLDLNKSIELAMEKSHSMRRLKQNVMQSSFELKAATSMLRTHIDLDMTAPNYTETIKQYEDSTGITFYDVNRLEYSGSLRISQPLPSDGDLSLRTGLYNINDYGESRNSFRLFSRLEFYQPVEALYIYNNIKSEFKKAKLNYELSQKRFKREELDVIYRISQAFYQLVSASEKKRIAMQSLKRQEESNQIAQNKYNAGLIMEVEALQMEVDLGGARNDFDMAETNYAEQANLLKQLLGLTLKDSLVLEINLSYKPVNVDMDKALNYGLSNRLELREREINVELSGIEVKRRKSEGMPTGGVSAYYDFIGTSNHKLPVAFSESFNSSMDNMKNSLGNFGVAFTLNIPIFDWGENRSRVNAAMASLEMNKINLDESKIQIEREIRNTVNQLRSSLRRLQLLEKSVALAEKSFEISSLRYSNGDIDNQAFALDRERLNKARLSFLEAYTSYKLNIADLLRQTFYDFENEKAVN